MAREELGLNPQDLGSPVTAAASSFLMFASGAILPVLPYLFLTEGAALIAAAMLGAAGLLAVGGSVSVVTDRGVWTSALRMLAIGGAAAVITYVVGIGVSV